MSVQDNLNAAYQPLVERDQVIGRLHAANSSEDVLKELNGPFLISCNAQYEQAKPRIVIVGQENNGWLEWDYSTQLYERHIEDALDVYRNFDIAEYSSGFFGRYFALLRDQFQGPASDTNRRAVLYNNLFKLNHNGESSIRSPHLETMLAIQGDVFVQEIEALEPDAVIFLTGPDYDFVLERFYPDIVFAEVDEHPLNELAQITAKRIPGLAYRTYHPQHLNYVISKKPHCIDAIVNGIKAKHPGDNNSQ